MVDISDIMTYASFGDDRLRSIGVAEWSNSAISHRRLSSSLKHSRTTVHVCDSSEKNEKMRGNLIQISNALYAAILLYQYERNCVLTCSVYVDFHDAKFYGVSD